GHRSMALAPREAVSSDWMNYVDATSPNGVPYLARLKARGVTHMLVIGDLSGIGVLSGCVRGVSGGPHYDHIATRNPRNVGERYTAWIVGFDSKSLPGCAAHPA